MAVRPLSAAAVFAAAVVVCALVRSRVRGRRLRCEAVSQRLVAGCAARDNVALRDQLEAFRLRLAQEVAPPADVASAVVEAPAAPAGRRADGAPSVPHPLVEPSLEGGPQ